MGMLSNSGARRTFERSRLEKLTLAPTEVGRPPDIRVRVFEEGVVRETVLLA